MAVRLIASLACVLALNVTGGPRDCMPYSLVYEQNWAEGNSDFTENANYTSASDPLYPEVKHGTDVETSAGAGPGGENTLPKWTSGDWFDAGVWLNLPTVAGSGYVITEGAAEIWYKPSADSIANNTNCPLMHLFEDDATSNQGDIGLTAFSLGGGTMARHSDHLPDGMEGRHRRDGVHPRARGWRYRSESD
jgi:hypothetical protein